MLSSYSDYRGKLEKLEDMQRQEILSMALAGKEINREALVEIEQDTKDRIAALELEYDESFRTVQ